MYKVLEGKRFLVTGGAGFIGSHLTRRLLELGGFVRVIDNLSTGRLGNLESIRSGADEDSLEVVIGDIRDPGILDALADVDYVLHQAALGSAPRSIENPLATHENNVTGTLRVLEAARKAGVKRVVCASSSSVYGGSPGQQSESHAVSPMTPYAASKLAVENYATSYAKSMNLQVACLRYFNVFGPGQDPEGPYAAVVPRFFQAAMAEGPLTLHGDGEQTRDFTYIENVVGANLRALAVVGLPERAVFNVGCGSQLSIHDLARLVRKIAGSTSQITFGPYRAGDPRSSMADLSLSMQWLGYSPIDAITGLQETYSRLHESEIM